MASYNKTVDFLAKDSLLTGNPAKKVKGSEIDTEFNNLATADADNVKESALGTGVATALAVNVGSAGAPVLFDGAGGTPSSLTGTNITGTAAGLTAGVASAVAVGGITGLGTGVATALAVNVGSAGAPVLFDGALGTPSSGNLANCTGYPTAAAIPTGATFDYVGSSAPTGYVLLDGKTIGNGSSGGTERANADTVDLYTLLWNSMADAQAAVSTGRGASAAADFAANKTITLPDARGRVIAGKDDMGGSTASRVTNAGAGIVGTTLGVAGGSQTHTLTTAQLASHAHSHAHTSSLGDGTGGGLILAQGLISQTAVLTSIASATDATTAGSGDAHNNTQPTLILNKIIKL